MSIGERIRKLRREKDWTQRELGERAGIGGKNVSSYESGHLKPSRKTVQRFADALGVGVEALLEETPQQALLALEDPELLTLFKEVAHLPELEQAKIKWFLSLAIKQNRIQQMIAS